MSDPAPAATPPASPRIPAYGEYIPIFRALSDQNPNFSLYSLGGSWMILMFHGSLAVDGAVQAYQRILARRAVFDDKDAYFFGVSIDTVDRETRGLKSSLPGLRYFWDFDAAVSRLYGVARDGVYTPTAFLVDRALRVVEIAPLSHIDALIDRLEREIVAERTAPEIMAPILTIPRIFEPEFCAELIAYYERSGGERSGFMMGVGGKTVGRQDDRSKRRKDATVTDQALLDGARERLSYRLIPAIERALGWRATRVERYIVAHYSAADQGFFFPHRDNTSPGTQHRKFAVTLNLNAEDYDGGELRFPEFGRRTYKPPTGGATVFCCSLLHEATPVTRGERYAFLPFLYDEDGKRVRTANAHTIVPPS